MRRDVFDWRGVGLGLLSLLLFCAGAKADELLTWERIPLPVTLQVGQERIIFADRNVRVGLPQILSDKLRVQSTGGAVYLKANSAFPSTRLQLQDSENGEIILLDVTAGKTDATEPVRIIYPNEKQPDSAKEPQPQSQSPLSAPVPVLASLLIFTQKIMCKNR
ncbi:conjugal transfer protein [Xenorhabdus sp. KK7.4]|nr:conjugal transfer protein [Xenorhabdus sp. KK7.4]PHM55858.1 conjugal transfer protein [Xenorhabdus sp. KK7.4]